MAEETVETRLSVHEAICAQRYEGIENRLEEGSRRMSRIEYLLYITIAAVLLGPGVAAMFVKKLIGM
jgi:cell division protein FtsL